MAFGDLPLFRQQQARIYATVRCACGYVYEMGGGDQIECACGLILILEETTRGGFIARCEKPGLMPGQMNPRPQIIRWVQG